MATLDAILNANKLLTLQEKLKDAKGLKAKVLANQIRELQGEPRLNFEIPTKAITPKKYAFKKRTPEERFNYAIKSLQKQRRNLYDDYTNFKFLENPITGEDVKRNKRNIKKVNKDIEKFNKQIDKKIVKELKTKIETTKPGQSFRITLSENNNLRDLYSAIESFTKYITRDEQVIIEIYTSESQDATPSYYTFNDRNRDRLREIVEESLSYSVGTGRYTGSDVETIEVISIAKYINVKIVPVGRKKKNGDKKTKPRGGFFPYYHKTKFDFTKYQIFKDDTEADYEDNCLVYALKMGGMHETKVNHFRMICKNREIPQCKFEQLCILSNIQINLKIGTDDIHDKIYGNSQEQYNVGLLEHHYFINEDINISTYCINNYEDVKDIKDCNLIIKKRTRGDYEKKKDYKISSFLLFKSLIEQSNTLLSPITYSNGLMKTQYHNKNDSISSLEYDEETCTKEVKLTEMLEKIQYTDKIFFDIETDPTGTSHIPFLVRTKQLINGEVVKKKYIGYGDKCILSFLTNIKNNSVLIAHNAGGYDSTFIVKFLYNYNEVCRANDVLSCSGTFRNLYLNRDIHLKIKDSLKLINMRLEEFPECFFPSEKNNFKKEVMPYNLYTKNNIEKVYCKIQEAIQILKQSGKEQQDINQFLDNIEKWNVRKDDTFDIITYADIYCERDVDILERGYEIFRGWMIELTGFDVDNIISLASLSDKNLINQGCYDECYSLSGIPQAFIMKCVVGGRCMTRQNKRYKCKEVMQALDAKSLYPSAMNRMGFLKGIPKVIKQDELTYEQIQQYDGFFVEVVATGLSKKRDFPLLSFIDSNGIRNFSNDVIGKTFYLDKTMFEDAQEYQGITFDIKRGYYFNQGFNYKIKEVIREMYNARVEKKRKTAEFPEGNPIERAYKELLNCAYGKTILKATEYEFKYIDGDDKFNDFLRYNYNFIQEYNMITHNKYKIKVIKAIDTHFNRPHIGVSILSMSKRIMNEVMCLAEDNSVIIAYQDTDSASIRDSDIPKLSELYFNKYGRPLVGEDMGNFGNDLKFSYEDENGNMKKAKNVKSVESQFLGKKCYHHRLQGQDAKGNNVYGDYIRLKGVSGDAITHICKNEKIEVNQLYLELIEGYTKTFDLLCKDETGRAMKVAFQKNKNKTITSKTKFERDINFNRVHYVEYEGFERY
jgi:hypothetical protein